MTDEKLKAAADEYVKTANIGPGPYGVDAIEMFMFSAYLEGAEFEREKAKVLVEALNHVLVHYQHPMHDHNWAYYAKEVCEKALKSYEASE